MVPGCITVWIAPPRITICKAVFNPQNNIFRLKVCAVWNSSHCPYMAAAAAAAAKSLQSCLILCNPIDSSPPGFPAPGILQARTLEWIAISFSNAWKWKVKVKSLSRVWLLVVLWTAAYQAPASMGFPRQEYWSGMPLPSPHIWLLKFKFSSVAPLCPTLWDPMDCTPLGLPVHHQVLKFKLI